MEPSISSSSAAADSCRDLLHMTDHVRPKTSVQTSPEHKIFVIGSLKTGTTSMAAALGTLLGRKRRVCKWGVPKLWPAGIEEFAAQISNGTTPWHHFLASCTAVSDNPWWLLAGPLMAAYPNGSFILTRWSGGCDAWLEHFSGLYQWGTGHFQGRSSKPHWKADVNEWHRCIFGGATNLTEATRSAFLARCETHERVAIQTARKLGRRLLIFETDRLSDEERWDAVRNFLMEDFADDQHGWRNVTLLGSWPNIQTPGKTQKIVFNHTSDEQRPRREVVVSNSAVAQRRDDRPCFCFSLCTPKQAHRFISSIPDTIDANSPSPWNSYLDKVYGLDRPRMTVNLSAFNFFYSDQLSSGSPTVRGIAPCNATGLTGPLPVSTTPTCAEADCEDWLAPPAERDAKRLSWMNRTVDVWSMHPASAHTIGRRGGRLQTDRAAPLAVGTAIFEDPPLVASAYAQCMRTNFEDNSSSWCAQASESSCHRWQYGSTNSARTLQHQPRGLGTDTLGSHEWVEVMRVEERFMITQNPLHRKTVEGKEGYGCWYNRATGSGIWLNVGRTFVLDGDDALDRLERAWNGSSIDRERVWRTNPHAPLDKYEASLDIANALGYETVQLSGPNCFHSRHEIVVTTDNCMRPKPTSWLLMTCTASAGVSLRTGWRAAGGACECNESLPTLNCRGVYPDRSLPLPAKH